MQILGLWSLFQFKHYVTWSEYRSFDICDQHQSWFIHLFIMWILWSLRGGAAFGRSSCDETFNVTEKRKKIDVAWTHLSPWLLVKMYLYDYFKLATLTALTFIIRSPSYFFKDIDGSPLRHWWISVRKFSKTCNIVLSLSRKILYPLLRKIP